MEKSETAMVSKRKHWVDVVRGICMTAIAVSDFSISLIRSFLNRYVSLMLFFLNHLQTERFDECGKFLLL